MHFASVTVPPSAVIASSPLPLKTELTITELPLSLKKAPPNNMLLLSANVEFTTTVPYWTENSAPPEPPGAVLEENVQFAINRSPFRLKSAPPPPSLPALLKYSSQPSMTAVLL